MIDKKVEVIIVDAGNTQIKVAQYSSGKLIDLQRLEKNDHANFIKIIEEVGQPPVFVASVLDPEDLSKFLGNCPNVRQFHTKMNLPLNVAYSTPETLGLDRLANAVAIHSKPEGGPKVAIDFGTCIKFDLVDETGSYIGGSISPGVNMRYQALHHYTGKLPLLAPQYSTPLIGNDSKSSIHAGIIHGIQGEVNHFISSYLQDYQGLTFFVTGGDAKFFEFPRKNNIFADENLTLFGLYKIYLLNA